VTPGVKTGTDGDKASYLRAVDRARVKVSARIFAGIAAAGRAAGVDADAVLARLGIDTALFGDADARLPLALEDALWDAMARASGDPCFGLHASRHVTGGDWDVFGYAVRTSATLRDAVRALVRYNRLMHDVAVIALIEEGERARITHHFPGDPRGASLHAADYTIASIVTLARALSRVDIVPLGIRRMHPPPRDEGCYHAVFGARVELEHGAPQNEVIFARTVMDLPIVSSDPSLHAVLLRHADDLLARLPKIDDVPSQVREAITAELRGGDPSLEAIAKKLGLGPRTLQRKLGEHGVRYQDLLDELRRELALAYLRDPRLAIAEVAYLLAFSEPRAFHRAFRRWTASTPSVWRAAQSG
jgi:AraC-like DNA-binding protein